MPARIHVLAGVNGAGKSSIGGAALHSRDVPYFNPDLAARALQEAHPGLGLESANGQAWEIGRGMLERALHEGLNYAFETTLGAATITGMLLDGAARGAQIHVWYAGLASVELHMRRVQERVVAGGHDIPEQKIRERYTSSRANLIRLIPVLASLRVYDNSAQGDPKAGKAPKPVLLLHMAQGSIVSLAPLAEIPDWAKPIVVAAMQAGSPHRPN